MKNLFFLLLLFGCNVTTNETYSERKTNNYQDLVDLFKDWRKFESPPLLNGAPDYTQERFNNDQEKFSELRDKLNNFDINKWSISNQIDWHIVRAEMNGYDFNYRVLRPWQRDPAFYQTIWMYQSDVPAHEGPTNHGVLEFWMYNIPLNQESEKKLLKELKSITPFLEQARINLTGNARNFGWQELKI